jgi:Xaa-Pro aminopeptidase
MLQLRGLPVVPDPRPSRRARLLETLALSKAEAMLVSHLPNVRYLSGFTGSNALLLVSPKKSILYTDPRYDFQASAECDCAVKVLTGPTWTDALKDIARKRIGRVAFEATRVTHNQWLEAAGILGKTTKLTGVGALIDRQRMVKSASEIELIRRSVLLASKVYEKAIRKVKPETTELALAATIDFDMRKLGASGPSFETIVASGAHSALPHARPRAVQVGRDQLLLVDMGACLDGYASDMTRMAHLGRPTAKATDLHSAVLEAQLAAIGMVRAGVEARKVDEAARQCLKKRKLDKAFMHSTGHGLGLEIHEDPRIGRTSADTLEAGMVITIEPGAYLEGYGGVRIEDTILVTETGAEILTPTAKELLVIAS